MQPEGGHDSTHKFFPIFFFVLSHKAELCQHDHNQDYQEDPRNHSDRKQDTHDHSDYELNYRDQEPHYRDIRIRIIGV